MSVLHNIFFFIVAIGILVAFHEFGHYWVARKMGVKVLRFSIGFGKPLYTWTRKTGEDSIEYVVAAIPLGGYVKMLDEREGEVSEAERKRAFNTQPLSSRAAIVAAGPLFNFILAIIFYWVIFISGVTVEKPLLGEPAVDTAAALAGFQKRDEVLSVNEKDVRSLNDFRLAVLEQGLDGGVLEVRVINASGLKEIRRLDLAATKLLDDEGDVLDKLGFSQWWPDLPPQIGGVLQEAAASQAGLQEGDLIIAIDEEPVEKWEAIVEKVRKSPGLHLRFLIEREGAQQVVNVIPGSRETNGVSTGYIGAYQKIPDTLRDEVLVTIQYDIFEAIPYAIEKTWDMSVLTLRVLWKMIVGEAALANISGPITIAQYAGVTAKIGLNTFIGFLAIISVSLGVLNLLPVPMLDGGHLFYYLIEAVKGSPVSEAVETIGQQIGIAILAVLMFIALFNDFQRLMQ